jgi:hypothetical protein
MVTILVQPSFLSFLLRLFAVLERCTMYVCF